MGVYSLGEFVCIMGIANPTENIPIKNDGTPWTFILFESTMDLRTPWIFNVYKGSFKIIHIYVCIYTFYYYLIES